MFIVGLYIANKCVYYNVSIHIVFQNCFNCSLIPYPILSMIIHLNRKNLNFLSPEDNPLRRVSVNPKIISETRNLFLAKKGYRP